MQDTAGENTTKSDQFSFVKAEHQVLDFWKKEKIFKRSLEQTKDGDPYIFYDGPPFATGLPHHGHIVGQILKDVIPRYFTMKGRYVDRRFGWDTHGLPIEHEIDKELGMSAQAAVREYGVAGYNKKCRGIVQRYVAEWEKTVDRIGRWVDFENDYKTMDLPFMESVWWVFSKLWEKDLVYRGTKIVPYSTALGTVLSNFEAGQNYMDVQDPAVTVLFKLKDHDDYIAAWTTTPWTLPSNLGLTVGADLDYVRVKEKKSGKTLILAKSRLEHYGKKRDLEILGEKKGSELKGLRYEPLFPYFKELAKDGAFQIFNDDYVTTDDGTGVVHTAPSFGEDDNRVMREAGVNLDVCPLDVGGHFTDEVADFAGQYVKDADKNIIKHLKESGQLWEQSTLVHSYPYCYRSDTPLIYRSIPSWYVKVEAIKDRLIKNNQQINWIPDHIKEGRMGKWLEGARDWAISRNRYWGTPLPIWENDETGNQVCLGSIEELKNLTGHEATDLHREHVDDLTFTKDGEAGTYRRVEGVFDCWFESGSMPYCQLHYPFENQDLFKRGFPAEYIAEGQDQTRGWFYTLTILSTALFDSPAFKNVIVNGIVAAEDGKKMSKRLKNYTPPDDLMEEYGADALRLYLISSGLVRAEDMRFSDEGVRDMVRRVLLPWYNAFKFFHTYSQVDGWCVSKHKASPNNVMDRWILSNLQTLKKNISVEMDRYHLYNVLPALLTFIDDLTNWYIRLNRGRFWAEGLCKDKKAAFSTLYMCLKELSQAMAPFTPFLSDHLFRQLTHALHNEDMEKESVHLCEYPMADESLMDPLLEQAVGRMQQIVELGRTQRNTHKVKTKTPLRKLVVIHKDQKLLDGIKNVEELLKTELNVKEIAYDTDEAKYVGLTAKPNLKVLGKRLGKRMGQFKKLIEGLSSDELVKVEAGESVTLEGETFGPEDILVFRGAKPGTNALSNRYISIDLDCTLDDELHQEGLAREVVNRIQKTRKEMDLHVADRISITYSTEGELGDAILKHADYIKGETLAQDLQAGEVPTDATGAFVYQVEKWPINLAISKC